MFDPWIEKIPWRREVLSTPVFLPGESHGLRQLESYSPWGHKELDKNEYTHQKKIYIILMKKQIQNTILIKIVAKPFNVRS